MDKINFAALIFGILTIFSCTGTNVVGSPDVTMKGFIEKMKIQDFAAAKEYTNNNTDATMEFLDTRIKILREMGKEEEIASLFGGIDFSKVSSSCITTDNKSVCKCCENDTENCKDISLVQEGGKWLINMPKESTFE